MKKNYSIHLEKISLEYFKSIIKNKTFTASRRILGQDIESRFKMFESLCFNNLGDLIKNLNSAEKVRNVSMQTGLSEEYLKILSREARSYNPKPVALNSFPGVNTSLIELLAAHKIKNSKHLFDLVHSESGILKELEKSTSMKDELDELISLSDLARLYGVGPVFAKMIYKAGVTSVDDFAGYSAEDFIHIYENESGKKADFSISDIQFSIEMAKLLIE